LAVWLAFRLGWAGYLRRLRGDLSRALLRWPALPVQLGSSLLVLASYLGVFLFLAAGAGYLNSVETALVIAALGSMLLLSMVIPLTVAGWGIRESAAAILWPLAGLPAEQGVALSVGYGALVFVSSMPGLVFAFSGKLRLA
ncbi:MAG: flippase-like domain-containing protein, partial [Marinobacter sp.]|nr:flippase-like domain-containing protein [Marinobacter sp.]